MRGRRGEVEMGGRRGEVEMRGRRGKVEIREVGCLARVGSRPASTSQARVGGVSMLRGGRLFVRWGVARAEG